MSHAVVVDQVSKRFRIFPAGRASTLQEAFVRGMRPSHPVATRWALQDISFRVGRGETFGIIGANGSGKSTLLRLLGQVMRPDRGSVQVKGRTGALLDLGAGFHHDLTGRENVFVSGIVGGLTRREVASKLDSIVAFSELEQFIDNPLRTYSTGMQMRLAFAVAIHIQPDVLLIDEVLAVGDAAFQRKCLDRVDQFRADGCSIVIVSHDVSVIRDLCDSAIWLRNGEVAYRGAAEDVVDHYLAQVAEVNCQREAQAADNRRQAAGTKLIMNENRFGSLDLEITRVHLRDGFGMDLDEIESGSGLKVDIDFTISPSIDAAAFQVYVHREDGLVCYNLDTLIDRVRDIGDARDARLALSVDRIDLASGTYYVDVGAYTPDWKQTYDYHSRVYPFTISGGKSDAILAVPHHWTLRRGRVFGPVDT